MPQDPAKTAIFHITPLSNLPSIIAAGGLHSDAGLGEVPHQVIGYGHIKQRRLTEYRIPCCGNRFVGEFVPFYYAPRSPMLFAINKGNTGLPQGCQTTIVHLVSTVAGGMGVGGDWAISDGNAGAAHALFYKHLAALEELDWAAIKATNWAGRTHAKSAEFLVADFMPLGAIGHIGCFDESAATIVREMLATGSWKPGVSVRRNWYY